MDKNNIKSSSLYTDPSFIKGMARLGDYFGTVNEYNYSTSGEEADKKGIERDWAVIGTELETALHNYETESTK